MAEDTLIKTIIEYTILCKHCGEEFLSINKKRQYCDVCQKKLPAIQHQKRYIKKHGKPFTHFERKCKICETAFTTKVPAKIFCDDCAKEKYEKKNEYMFNSEKGVYIKTCQKCNCGFEAAHYNKKFCNSCKRENKLESRREWYKRKKSQ